MQCYEYLAIRQYARPILGSDSDRYDDLDLADRLEELEVESIRDVDRLKRTEEVRGSTSH